jgi:hypothetical protein
VLAMGQCHESHSALDEACEVLEHLLADGPMAATEVKKLAGEAGIRPRTLDRAKERLGVQVAKSSYGGPWLWQRSSSPSAPSRAQERQPSTLALLGEDGALGAKGSSDAI